MCRRRETLISVIKTTGAEETIRSDGRGGGVNWTTEKPTVPGWYFWRKPALSNYPTMVLVQFTPDQRSLYSLFHDGNSEQDEQRVQLLDSIEWAGPLEPPL